MKYLVLEIGVEKRKDTFEDKNCSTEIEHAIEEHKRKNKEKKEAKEKDLPLDVLNINL